MAQKQNTVTREVHFTKDWNNKLSCEYFTTIRKFPTSYVEGEYYKVYVNKVHSFNAKLMSVEIAVIAELPAGLICVDTGYSLNESYKLFRSFGIDTTSVEVNCVVLTFKRIW